MKILHIGNHHSENKNSGDTLLFPVTRDLFNFFCPDIKWTLSHIFENFSLERAKACNVQQDAILIGGGGMFLRDHDGSDITKSGWQWNCSIEALENIKIPIIIYGVGYNRFRGQEEFDPIFSDHLNILFEKAKFIGLRNSGSIRAIRNYLKQELASKIDLQYCPTTVLWQIRKDFRVLSKKWRMEDKKILAFNPALDRTDYRFKYDIEKSLNPILQSLIEATKLGWEILLVAHKQMDHSISPLLNKKGISYSLVDLSNSEPDEICTFYSQIDCSFGMRGHSQLIPLGLRKPIISIITHDKMKFLLEDIEQRNWGIELDSPHFLTDFREIITYLSENKDKIYKRLDSIQEKIWQKTSENFQKILP